MSISKFITSASLAFAMIGGTIVLAPSDAAAASKKNSFISNPVLEKNRDFRKGMGGQANPYKRPCNKQNRCQRG